MDVARGRRTTADALIAEADTAMYLSKHDGGGHAVLYTDEMAPTATR